MKQKARVRIGLLGLGNVGGGVVEILGRHHKLIAQRSGVDLEIVRALVRDPRRERHPAAAKVEMTTRAEDIVGARDIDVVCELLGGVQPASALIARALQSGKPVVTANKAVLALHGPKLFRQAAGSGADLSFEGSVAGGLPIIRTLREGLAADRVTRLLGILNGTTNFVLGKMEHGHDYAAAVREAQALGFAEADPTLDVSGRDAADKLSILLLLAFGISVKPASIPTTGITALTPEILADADLLGYRVKLLAQGERHKAGVEASVQPAFVPLSHPLSTVSGAENAVAVVSDALGRTLYQGQGAGGLPTGSAVVADLIEAGRNLKAGIGARVPPMHKGLGLAASQSRAPYSLRLSVRDRPGVLAAVTRIFAARGLSLATVLQRERAGDPSSAVPILLVTHPAPDAAMQAARKQLEKLRALRGPVRVIRILQGDG